MTIIPTREALLAGALLLAIVASPQAASAARDRPVLPDIRLASGESVPACVTPGRLNRHLLERTRDLEPRFRDIANYYKQHGEALRIHADVGAKRSLGIHWGVFQLTDEALDEPPRKLAELRSLRGMAEEEFFVTALGQTARLAPRRAFSPPCET